MTTKQPQELNAHHHSKRGLNPVNVIAARNTHTHTHRDMGKTTGWNTGTHMYPYIYGWMVPLIPAWISPNWLTTINIMTQLAYLAHFLAAGRHNFPLLAVTLVVYRVIDNVDGMHARRTKQTSKLGEYLVCDVVWFRHRCRRCRCRFIPFSELVVSLSRCRVAAPHLHRITRSTPFTSQYCGTFP